MATDDNSLLCFICAEELNRGTTGVDRPCCRNILCQTCMYRHIMSILNDDVGSFRKLTCPFGCGVELTDDEIREAFSHSHQFRFMAAIRYFCHSLCRSISPNLSWWYVRLSSRERRDMEVYLRWSLQRGLADMRKKNDDLIMLECPGVDCNYTWIVADPRFRRNKQQHENRYYLLWYKPYQGAEDAPNYFVDGSGRPIWVQPQRRRLDVRQMICPACHANFCGLCRNPWVFGRVCHARRSCRTYTRLPSLQAEGSLADRFALASYGHHCPGCRLATERISGCNHMTCPCGVEWCYACGQRWNTLHYGCRDRAPNEDPGCVIL